MPLTTRSSSRNEWEYEQICIITGRSDLGRFSGAEMLDVTQFSYRLFAEQNESRAIDAEFLLNDFVGIDGVLNDVHVLLHFGTERRRERGRRRARPSLFELISQFAIAAFLVVQHANRLEDLRFSSSRTDGFTSSRISLFRVKATGRSLIILSKV